MLRKLGFVVLAIFVIGGGFALYLEHRLNGALNKYDDLLNFGNAQAFEESLLALDELVETGLFIIRWSRFKDQVLRTYRDISHRIGDFENKLREYTDHNGLAFGRPASEIIHDITIHKCKVYAVGAERYNDIAVAGLAKGITLDCNSAVAMEKQKKQFKQLQREDELSRQYFEARCAGGDSGACDAVGEINRPRVRPSVQEQMERNCRNGDTSACAYLDRQ